MAKRVRVSDDGGTAWYTLPGNTAEMSDEAGQINDTVFGQNFESNQTGLIGWTITANALYKGFAGYVASIKSISGASVATTGEAMTSLAAGTYQVTDGTRQIMDRAADITVYDDAVDVTANVETFDYLHGIVYFAAGSEPAGTVTMDFNYFNTSVIGRGQSFTLTQEADGIDNTTFQIAQGNDGHRTYEQGLQRVSLEIGGIYAAANGFRAALAAREELIIEIAPSGDTTGSFCRGFFKYVSRSQSGDVGALEEETVNFSLSVPADDSLEVPFKWQHPATSTLTMAVQKCLNAWEGRDSIDVQYLPDGSTGFSGEAFMTELTLSGGLEVMNEFSVTFQGSDQVTVVS